MQWKTSLLEWWLLISEKRCDSYAHSQEEYYNEALKEYFNNNLYPFCSSHKIWISGIRAICSLLFLMHVPNEVRVQRIGSLACFP